MGYHEYIKKAVKAGYVPNDDGSILTPFGGLIIGKIYGAQRYPTITIPKSITGTNKGFGIPIHKLNAYFWYGSEALKTCVRHLDGNTLNNKRNNLCLGSYSDNEQDKCPIQRIRVAKYARSCQPKTSYNAKLSLADVEAIRKAYAPYKDKKAPNGFCKSLCSKYEVSRTVISKVVRGLHYGE